MHEYGGKSWLLVPAEDDRRASLVFANWSDQRLYLLEDGSDEPRALTPEPAEPAGLRYADPVLDGDHAEVLCVREAHHDGQVVRHIVAVPLDGSAAEDGSRIREVAGGSQFLAYPRIFPDGRHLAWIAWDHPRMPWDGTELRVAPLDDGIAGPARTLLGGPEESVLQARDVYVQRSPLSHVDQLSCPVLLLQGSEDRVVPRSQSLMFRDALAGKGVPHAYLEFEGEQHGFRKASSIITSYEAELSFYGQVFGFNPPGVPKLQLSTGGQS